MAGKSGILNVVVGARITDFLTKMQVVKRETRNTAKTAKTSSVAFSGAFVTAFAAVGAASITMAAKLETSLVKIETLVGISEDVVKGFRSEVIKLSNETGKSAVEIGDALFVVTSAGLRGADALEVLGLSAKAAAIGLGETKDIARALTGVLQAYTKQGLTAARATEILLATVEQGNLSAAELAPVLGRVVALASTLGVSFEEVGANIAVFTRLGVSAEEAVTGLRQVMASIIKPTTQAKEAFENLVDGGLDAVKKSIADNGLHATLIDLVEITDGNNEALSTMFGNIRALANVLGTAVAQGGAYNDVFEEVAKNNERADKGFERVSRTTEQKANVAIENFKNAMIAAGDVSLAFALDVGEAMAAAMGGVKKDVDDATESVNELAIALGLASRKIKFAFPTKPILPKGRLKGKGVVDDPDDKEDRSVPFSESGVVFPTKGLFESGERTPMVFETLEAMEAIGPAAVKAEDDTVIALEHIETSAEKTARALGNVSQGFNMIGDVASSVSKLTNNLAKKDEQEMLARQEREISNLDLKFDKTVRGEREKQAALTQLRAKQEEERKAAARASGIEQKKLMTLMAVVNTAAAITRALAEHEFPYSLGVAAAMAAAGAVEIAAIDAQTVGFQAGGIVGSGGTAMVGERGPELLNLPAGSQITPNHALGGGKQLMATVDGDKFVVWMGKQQDRHNFRS